MVNEKYKKLVYDALNENEIERIHCIRFNLSAEKLRKQEPTIMMTVIEEIILNEIPVSLTEKNLFEKYPGLGRVLIEYFHIANYYNSFQAKEFLGSLQGSIRIKALSSLISIHYSPIPRTPVAREIIPLLSELKKNGTPREKELVSSLLSIKRKTAQVK